MATLTPDPRIVESIDALIKHLRDVLPPLMASGENWRVELHGSSNGQIIIERTAKAVVRPRANHRS